MNVGKQRDTEGWVSPGGSPMTAGPAVAPPDPAATEVPPAGGESVPTAAPAAPVAARRGLSTGAKVAIWIGSITFGLLLIASIAAMLIAVVTSVSAGIRDGLDDGNVTVDPLLDGAAGSPLAADPQECADRCITGLDLPAIVLTETERDALELPETWAVFGDFPETTPGAELSATNRAWRDEKAEPDGCFFTNAAAPIAYGVDERPRYDGSTIHFVGEFSDADYWQSVLQYARVFENSAAAVEHMQTVDSLLAGCDQYTMGSGLSAWSPLVTPAPALEVPDSVAAVGWREDEAGSRFYVYDLQRGNLVVRVNMSAWQTTETEFREVVQAVAERLAAIDVAD